VWRLAEPRPSGEPLRDPGADLGEDLVRVSVLTGSFPGVDQVAIHHDLEHPSSRGDDHEFGDLELELF
jgi:hypothetical protein